MKGFVLALLAAALMTAILPHAAAAQASPENPAYCLNNGTSGPLLLNNSRFAVQVAWRTNDGREGIGWACKLTGDSSYYWFFGPNNVEMIIKVLDACGVNNRYWVFMGGLTDVGVDIYVTDRGDVNQPQKVYHNTLGHPFQPVQDTNAFATCPGSELNFSFDPIH